MKIVESQELPPAQVPAVTVWAGKLPPRKGHWSNFGARSAESFDEPGNLAWAKRCGLPDLKEPQALESLRHIAQAYLGHRRASEKDVWAHVTGPDYSAYQEQSTVLAFGGRSIVDRLIEVAPERVRRFSKEIAKEELRRFFDAPTRALEALKVLIFNSKMSSGAISEYVTNGIRWLCDARELLVAENVARLIAFARPRS